MWWRSRVNEIINARFRTLARDKATTMTTATVNRNHSVEYPQFNGYCMPCQSMKKILDVNPIILCIAFVSPPFVLYAMNEWLLCFPFLHGVLLLCKHQQQYVPFGLLHTQSLECQQKSIVSHRVRLSTIISILLSSVANARLTAVSVRKHFFSIRFDIYGLAPATKSAEESDTMMMEKLRRFCLRA